SRSHAIHDPRTHPSIFLFNDTAPTEIYTLSLHDALPICPPGKGRICRTTRCGKTSPHSAQHPTYKFPRPGQPLRPSRAWTRPGRSEEHTSELQSRGHLVCRLLLEKKKTSKSSS